MQRAGRLPPWNKSSLPLQYNISWLQFLQCKSDHLIIFAFICRCLEKSSWLEQCLSHENTVYLLLIVLTTSLCVSVFTSNISSKYTIYYYLLCGAVEKPWYFAGAAWLVLTVHGMVWCDQPQQTWKTPIWQQANVDDMNVIHFVVICHTPAGQIDQMDMGMDIHYTIATFLAGVH